MEYPKTFTDTAGREWTVRITVGTLARLKSIAGFTLDDIVPKVPSQSNKMQGLADLISDPLQVLTAVYAICKPAIDTLNLTFDQFAESGFEGEKSAEACEAAGFALLQAIHDFFLTGAPIKSPMRAAMVKRVLSLGQKIYDQEAVKMDQVMDQIETRVMKEIAKPLDLTALEANIDKAMSEASKKHAGGLPVSLASTPATAP